ncbi:ribosomal protein L7/L12 [Streptomyces sparsogenes]|uniref:ribosomal protein L7/L12 n=1 Tax=Streptomyces sparsogenes TaxID=67365 RepID=UPI0034096CA0
MEITAVVVLLLVIGLMWSSVERKLDRTQRTTARLERKVDLVLDHLGLQEPQPDLGRVTALLREGKKIHAVKEYREITGAGLKEAKEAVDRMD